MRNRRKKLLEKEEENLKKMQDLNLEKNDALAMVIAALITFIPVLILVVVIFMFVIWIIFLR